MEIIIGDIDLAQSAIDSEYKIIVLENLFELLINKSGGQNLVSTQEVDNIREMAFTKLKEKYPNSGLERR